MNNVVIFDLDGTLLNTLDDLTEAVNSALLQFSFPTHTKESIRKFIGNGINLLFERALPPQTDTKTKNECMKIFKNFYSENMYKNTKPYDGILDLLKELKLKGFLIAVVSNKFDKAVKELCNIYFSGLIDISVGQSEEIPPKPSPKGTLKVLNILGSKKAVFVGDSDVDILTAKNSDIISIGVTWGFRDKENLKGADYIAETPKELMKIITMINLP